MRRKYTALVPKTIKATRKTSKKLLKKVNFYIKNGTRRLKRLPKSIDNRLARSIHFLTK